MDNGRREAFRLLGVPANSDRTTLAHAYRRLALETHPDVSADPRAADRFVVLADAYRLASRPPSADPGSAAPATPGTSVRPGRAAGGVGPDEEARTDRSARARAFWISTSVVGVAPGPPIVAGPVMVRPAGSPPERGVGHG